MRNLQRELWSYGCDISAKDFNRLLLDTFHIMCPGFKDNERALLFEPQKAILYCKAIRKGVGVNLPDSMILRRLTNRRKAGMPGLMA